MLGLVWPLGLYVAEFADLRLTLATVLGFVAASTATAFLVRRWIVGGTRLRAATGGAALGLVLGALLVGAWIPVAAWLSGTTWDRLARSPLGDLPGDVLFVAVMSLFGTLVFAPVTFPIASLVCLLLRAVHGVSVQTEPTACASGHDPLSSDSRRRVDVATGDRE